MIRVSDQKIIGILAIIVVFCVGISLLLGFEKGQSQGYRQGLHEGQNTGRICRR